MEPMLIQIQANITNGVGGPIVPVKQLPESAPTIEPRNTILCAGQETFGLPLRPPCISTLGPSTVP
jgi:hypothetical protein